MHQGDSVAGLALSSASAAYADAVSRSSARVAVAGDIGGQTFTAGLYTSTSSLAISAGDITLDAKGDPNAIFIFQMATTLSTGAGRQIVLAAEPRASTSSGRLEPRRRWGPTPLSWVAYSRTNPSLWVRASR